MPTGWRRRTRFAWAVGLHMAFNLAILLVPDDWTEPSNTADALDTLEENERDLRQL